MRVVSRVEQRSRDLDGEPLISWVIAPKEKLEGANMTCCRLE